MPLSRKKGFYLFTALIMSGMTLSASATEQIAAPATPSAATPSIVTAPAQTPQTVPVPAEAPAKAADEESATSSIVAAEKAPAQPDTDPGAAAATTTTTTTTPEPANEPEEVTPASIKAAGIEPAPAHMLDSEEQKRAYASGVMLAHFIEEQLANQKNLHITLDKNILLAGIADTFSHQQKMSDEDIRLTMSVFDEQVKVLTLAQNAKKQAEDKAYLEAFTKREGVKKTKQGLLYLIDDKGEGPALKDTDTVQINYKGTLVDGTVVDGPQVYNAYQVFRVSEMPPVLRDSVKLIRKGGQITVVIPPSTLEKTKDEKDASPLNTLVIYTISVIAVNQP